MIWGNFFLEKKEIFDFFKLYSGTDFMRKLSSEMSDKQWMSGSLISVYPRKLDDSCIFLSYIEGKTSYLIFAQLRVSCEGENPL